MVAHSTPGPHTPYIDGVLCSRLALPVMRVQPAAFLRTTLPLDLSRLAELDSGRYHSIWLPDHMVSFWPDSIWTPEFTDLASASPSPHRHLDGLAVAAAAAVLTERVPLVSAVVDTVRRHPSLLAQTALTIDHLAKGRFILGLGSGESENTLPYGFDFARPVSRFEEALTVIRLLWESDGPVDFDGQFYSLHHARLDTEPYEGNPPQIWIGASGPRMLDIAGRHADGWWPAGAWTPEHYAEMLSAVRASAERAGRDPLAITPCFIQVCLIGKDEDALAEILQAPLVKAFLLQVSAETLRGFGFEHPMGESWRGFQDIDPAVLTRERILAFLDDVAPEMILAVVPHGTPNGGREDHQDVRRCGFARAENPRLRRHGRPELRGVVCSQRPRGRRRTDAAVRRPVVTARLDAAELLARRAGRNRIARLRRPHLAGALHRRRRPSQRPRHGRRRHREAAQVCRWLLTSRLEFIEDRNRYPIGDEVIEAPMFVTGEPRSGTTLMHALMSVDPHARALRFWEVMYPSPPPGLAGPDDDRRERADADWREINGKMPKWLHSHPYNDMLGDGLPEDERTWAFDFRVMTPTAWWRVPMQSLVGGLATDPAAQYRLHNAMLQQLQYQRPRKYWVLKGFHGFRLKEMFDAYPDATLVWLHRDPVQVAASRTMMMADIAEGIVGPVDLHAEAKMHLELTRASVANTMSNPTGRRSAHPAHPLRRFHRRPGRHGAALLHVLRPHADARSRIRDACLSGQQSR